jgi:tetratricopeptide (TPR) repeat protein
MGPFQEHRLSEAGVRLVHYADPLKDQSELVKILNRLAGNDDSPQSSMATREASSLCPFPGLEFFDRNRAAMFFGRESEISEAAQRLGQTAGGRHVRWLQIEGPSGAGKSSLARAGVIPAVLEKNEWVQGVPRLWRVAAFRPGVDPVMSLAHAVRAALAEELGNRHPLGEIVAAFHARPEELAAFLRQHTPADHGFLLVVDQLEEAFTFGAEDARKAFDGLMASAMRDKGGPLYVISTIRSDFVGRMSALPELEGLLNAEAERYHLKTMSAPGMRAAMVEPAKLAGLQWEKNLPERLLKHASRSEGGLPLLAHALQALWVAREGNALTHSAYDELGKIGGAVSRSADAILESLGEDGKARAKRLLLRLVKIGRGTENTRRTASREEAIEAAGWGTEAERVLGRLSGERDPDKPEGAAAEPRLLVVSQDEADEGRVDLVHEALLRQWATLRRWIDEGRKALERRDDLEAAAQVWDARGASLDELPGGSLLAYLRGAEATGQLAQRFLKAAIAKEQKRIRRRWLTATGLAVAVIAFGGIGAFARESQIARSRQKAMSDIAAQLLSDIDHKLALIPETEAVRKDYRPKLYEFQESLIDETANDKPSLRYRMVIHGERGDRAWNQGDPNKAQQEYELSLDAAKKIGAPNPQDVNLLLELSVTYRRLGNLRMEGRDLSAAHVFFDKALDLTKARAAADSQNAAAQRDLFRSYAMLGDVARASGDFSAAGGFFDKALEVINKLAADPYKAALQRDLSMKYDQLAFAQDSGDSGAAHGFFEKSRELTTAFAATEQTNPAVRPDSSASYAKLGDVAQAGGDLRTARGFFEKDLEMAVARAAADPRNPALRRDLYVSYNKLGNVAQAGGDLSAARGFFDKALEVSKKLATGTHNADLKHDLFVSYYRLGDVARASGDFSAARGFFDKALDQIKMLAAANARSADLQVELASIHVLLTSLAIQMNDSAASNAHLQAATAILDQLDRNELGKGKEGERAALRAMMTLAAFVSK